MSTDEKEILDYLKAFSNTFVSGREIARRVGGKHRHAEDRFWAVPILTELVRKGVIECDAMACFRIVKEDRKKRNAARRHLSPEIARILKSSGKKFEGVAIDGDADDSAAPTPLNPPTDGES